MAQKTQSGQDQPQQDRTTVTARHDAERSRVEAALPSGDVAGFAEYRRSDGVYDFHHTEVFDEYGGQGIGSQLAAGVVEFVRSQGARLRPTCQFIQSYVRKHDDTHDVLADDVTLAEDRSDAR